MQIQHQQLVRDNPDAFSNEFRRRIPTSVDLLSPNSKLLQAIDRLPKNENVEFHSIIGDTCWFLDGGRSDGAVPVASARFPGATSEKIIRARHGDLHRAPEGIAELFRILRQHN